MKTAYLILVHRFPQQFMRLFRAIYHPNNYYLIHVDKRVRGGYIRRYKISWQAFLMHTSWRVKT